MKTIYNCWIVLSVLLLATSCNDEWTEEQYKQYISFAAPINDQGVMNIYVRYKTFFLFQEDKIKQRFLW